MPPMLRAIDAAKDFGIGVVPVRRSGHFGMADVFHPPRRASGLASAFLTSNASPGHGAVGVAREKRRRQQSLVLGRAGGTSPPPMILDIANTAVARGKLYLARQRRRADSG